MPEDTGTTETTDVAPENDGAEETTSTRVDSGAQLSQTEVDRIVESRLARERRKYADYDELKEKASAYDEAVAENQTEFEKVSNYAQSLEQQVEELTTANQYVAARSSLLQEVAKPENKIVDPEGAVEFLLGADQSLVEFGDDGTALNAPEAVAALTEKRSYLVSAETKTHTDADLGSRGGNSVSQLSEADLESMSPHDIVQARNEGRLDDVLAGK